MPHVIDYLLFDEYTEDPPIGSIPEGGFWYNTTEDRLKQKVGTVSGTQVRVYTVYEDIEANPAVSLNTEHSNTTSGNPHSVTKDEIGLGNVHNQAQLYRSSADYYSFSAKHTISGSEIFLVEDDSDTWQKKKVTVSGAIAGVHRSLRHLIHFIDEGPADGLASDAYKEVNGSLYPTSVVWYEDSSKNKKIVEKVITRSGTGTNLKPTPIVWRMYAVDGTTVVSTVTDTITYDGIYEVSRDRTITEP